MPALHMHLNVITLKIFILKIILFDYLNLINVFVIQNSFSLGMFF